MFFTQYIAKHKIKGESEDENEFILSQTVQSFTRAYPNMGIMEVDNAFNLYESNKLNFNEEPMPFYPVFNVGHCLKVLAAYEQYKTSQLEIEARSQKLYALPPKKEPTIEEMKQSEKDLIRRIWGDAEKGNRDDLSGAYIWQIMKKRKIADLPKSIVPQIQEWAVENVRNRLIEESKVSDWTEQKKIKGIILSLSNNTDRVKTEAAILASYNQCKKWQSEGKTVDEVIEKMIFE